MFYCMVVMGCVVRFRVGGVFRVLFVCGVVVICVLGFACVVVFVRVGVSARFYAPQAFVCGVCVCVFTIGNTDF